MRSKSRTVLTAAMAVLVLGAVAAASASAALPELKPAPTEREPLTFSVKMSGEKSGGVELVGAVGHEGGYYLDCEHGGTATGKFTGAKTGLITELVFTGCDASGTTRQCDTGKVLGEVRAEASIPVSLVYLSKEKHEVSLLANYYSSGTHTLIPRIACGVVNLGEVTGDTLLGSLTPIGSKARVFSSVVKAENGASKSYEREGLKASTSMSWLGSHGTGEAVGLGAAFSAEFSKEVTIEA